MPIPDSRGTILAAGFKGLQTVEALLGGQYAAIPDIPGLYAVFRLADKSARFTTTSAAAHYLGKNPTIAKEVLEAAWLPEAALLYLNKGASLRTRIRMLVEFGSGKVVAHPGGRALWQLADADDLWVGWKPTEAGKAEEAALRAAFADQYGADPFANAVS